MVYVSFSIYGLCVFFYLWLMCLFLFMVYVSFSIYGLCVFFYLWFMCLFLFMVYVSFSIYGLCVFFYFIFFIYTAPVAFPFFLSAQSLGCNRINPTIALALH